MFNLDCPPSSNGPFTNHNKFTTNLDENNEVITALRIEEYHLNNKGIVHGGVIATMLDNVIGDSISMIVNSSVITINLSINYLAPVKADSFLTATGKILQQGYKITTAEGVIKDEKGTLVAKGIGTFKITRE